jgi:hypothetical protein
LLAIKEFLFAQDGAGKVLFKAVSNGEDTDQIVALRLFF